MAYTEKVWIPQRGSTIHNPQSTIHKISGPTSNVKVEDEFFFKIFLSLFFSQKLFDFWFVCVWGGDSNRSNFFLFQRILYKIFLTLRPWRKNKRLWLRFSEVKTSDFNKTKNSFFFWGKIFPTTKPTVDFLISVSIHNPQSPILNPQST